ncbi:MAG: SDR family NAD(P)-dependent oxidoreductase [Chelatococcus sp.]|uniref:SDR family oxidoreductase n=1 Tax=Chelatococcus sp. TaxID=1953771 RepID=UPI0025BFB43D|nr:SDR family NAD(P)-dependent oxidoreductase [Chelatococcus sp.]MBX3536934.1 SDR family NAD(P)-dependent oxidoreductase [Chelatococcus sp.]
MGGLTGKIAWITGGGSGIGAAGARALAAAGAYVVVSGRREEALATVVDGIVAAGGAAAAAVVDVADEASVRGVADRIIAERGGIDILVASAGVNVPNRSFASLDPATWKTLIDVNLNGTMHAIQSVLPGMRARRDGLVIIVSSWVGRHPVLLGGPGYNSAKQAVVTLSHSLNMEECGNGIRSSVIMPGEVATDLIMKRPVPPPPEELERLLRPDDVGQMIRLVAEMPPRVCVNEVLISPTWNRNFIAAN